VGPKYTAEMHEAYRRKVDEKADKEAEELRERIEKETARRAWTSDGGNVSDFEREWPKLRDEGRRRRVMDANRRAREVMRSSGVSAI
jgi:vacuolar-type H+-ATPase subunit H